MNLWNAVGRRPPVGAFLDPQLEHLSQSLDPKNALLFSSLKKEKDSEMFFEGLFQLGQRLEADSRLDAASAVYQAIVQARPPLPRYAGHPLPPIQGPIGARERGNQEGPRQKVPSPPVGEGQGEGENAAHNHIQNRAQQRLAVLNGGGPSGLHSEYLLRRLSKETLEPTTLFGFGLASVGLRTVRLATLSRLATTPTANALTRGLGAQAVAGFLGAGAEAAMFPLGVRGAALALGRELDWSLEQVGKELKSSCLLLGAMRLTGGTARVLGRRMTDAVPLQNIFHQGATFGGFVLGHHLETVAGLRHPTDGSTLLLDSLATWAQVSVGGRIAGGVLGEGFARWERAMDIYTEGAVSLRGGSDPRTRRSNPFATSAVVAERLLRRLPAGRPPPRNDTSIPSTPGVSPRDIYSNPTIYMSAQGSGGGGKKKIKPAHTSEWFKILRTLEFRVRHLSPYHASLHLAGMALKFYQGQVQDAAATLLVRAKEYTTQVEMPEHVVHCLTAIGKVQLQMEQWEASRLTFKLARTWIEKLPLASQAQYYSELGFQQFQFTDPGAAVAFDAAERAISRLPEAERPSFNEHLALRLAQVGELEWAGMRIKLNPVGGRVASLTELAKGWAKKYRELARSEYLSHAMTAFRDAYHDFHAAKVHENPSLWHIPYTTLIRAALEAGPPFRQLAHDWSLEYASLVQKRWLDTSTSTFIVPALIQFLAESGEIAHAKRWLDFYPLMPEHRSLGVKHLAVELARTRGFAEATAFLEGERLFPLHRFEALLAIADVLFAAGFAERSLARKALLAARRLLMQSEIHASLGTRAASFRKLAERFQMAQADPNTLREILAQIPAALKIEASSPLELQRGLAEWDHMYLRFFHPYRVLPPVPNLFARLRESSRVGNLRKMRDNAIALGYQPKGLGYVLERRSAFHQNKLGWIQAWLYYGAALLPRPEMEREALATSIQELVASSFHGDAQDAGDQLAAKIHLILIQAMHLISPNLLQITLIQEIRNRLESPFPQLWKGPNWLGLLSFSESDHVLFHSLLYLARHGSIPNRAFVSELLAAPSLPPKWKEALEKALRNHGFLPLATEHILH